jgi:vacuolar-type H+-ATPase subunit H
MFDPAQLLSDLSEDFKKDVLPRLAKARADADAEVAAVKQAASQDVAKLVAAAKVDADKAVADAKAEAQKIAATARQDALNILNDLRGKVGSAAEVARADLMRAVSSAEPGTQAAVQNALRSSFNHILELLASSVL